ncbi:hypothetical protein VTI28DRAFT_3514 [Corynascus sepedonium]
MFDVCRCSMGIKRLLANALLPKTAGLTRGKTRCSAAPQRPARRSIMHGVEQCLCAVALAAKDLDTHNCLPFAQAVPVPDKQPQGIRYGNFLGFDPG